MLDIILEDLEFISDSIDIIEKRFAKINNPHDFVLTPDGVTLLDSIILRLQNIGEAVKNINKRDPAFLKKYPEVNWIDIIRFRDFVSHNYDEIDHVIVYNLCKDKLHNLKATIEIIIKDLNK